MSFLIANKIKINLCLVSIEILYTIHTILCATVHNWMQKTRIDFISYSSVYTFCINNNSYSTIIG